MDKRGVSIMVGYVLLIVIAISISLLVFGFLKLYVPNDPPECPANINLIIESASCDSTEAIITLSNRGLFSVDSVHISMGQQGRLAKEVIKSAEFDFGFSLGVELLPGDEWTSSLSHGVNIDLGSEEIEIEPAMLVNDELVLCQNAVSSIVLDCT
jgi:hypothetical protein